MKTNENMKTPLNMKEMKEHEINKSRNKRKQNERENMSKCESL
jgi:hypothetical protein